MMIMLNLTRFRTNTVLVRVIRVLSLQVPHQLSRSFSCGILRCSLFSRFVWRSCATSSKYIFPHVRPRTQVILNGVKFFGHGELFLESLRQVVEILSKSPEYKGGRSGRLVNLPVLL